jgi:phage repressor protein C with HTH and peptisase S24 domain
LGTSTVTPAEERDISTGFAERLAAALGSTPQAVVAKRANVSTSVVHKYLHGGTEPGLLKAARLAAALGVNLRWLATGEGAPNAAIGGYAGVPIYDVRLAAGAASFADGARVIGEMPFDLELLRNLGRSSPEALGVVEAEGDSMEPLISDGARVLIDFRDTRLREGVFAFRVGDELRIKRLRRTVDGVEILSENARYEPEHLVGPQLERFAIIGRALWSGSVI